MAGYDAASPPVFHLPSTSIVTMVPSAISFGGSFAPDHVPQPPPPPAPPPGLYTGVSVGAGDGYSFGTTPPDLPPHPDVTGYGMSLSPPIDFDDGGGISGTPSSNQMTHLNPPPSSSPSGSKIWVGGISPLTDEGSLRRYFEGFGVVDRVDVKRDRATGQSRGFAFVQFRDADSAAAAGSGTRAGGSGIDMLDENVGGGATGNSGEGEDSVAASIGGAGGGGPAPPVSGGKHVIDSRYVDVRPAQARGVAPPSIRGGGNRGLAGVEERRVGVGVGIGVTAAIATGAAVPPGTAAPSVQAGGLPAQPPQKNKLFVGGLPASVDGEEMAHYFARFGEVADAFVCRDGPVSRNGGGGQAGSGGSSTSGGRGGRKQQGGRPPRSRGFGFVIFEEEGGVKHAMGACPHTMRGKYVELKIAEPKPQLGLVATARGTMSGRDDAVVVPNGDIGASQGAMCDNNSPPGNGEDFYSFTGAWKAGYEAGHHDGTSGGGNRVIFSVTSENSRLKEENQRLVVETVSLRDARDFPSNEECRLREENQLLREALDGAVGYSELQNTLINENSSLKEEIRRLTAKPASFKDASAHLEPSPKEYRLKEEVQQLKAETRSLRGALGEAKLGANSRPDQHTTTAENHCSKVENQRLTSETPSRRAARDETRVTMNGTSPNQATTSEHFRLRKENRRLTNETLTLKETIASIKAAANDFRHFRSDGAKVVGGGNNNTDHGFSEGCRAMCRLFDDLAHGAEDKKIVDALFAEGPQLLPQNTDTGLGGPLPG